MFIVFHKDYSTSQEQTLLQEKLPLHHEFGDACTKINTFKTLTTESEHEEYCSSELRIKTRKRCTFFIDLQLQNSNQKVSICFLSTPDWCTNRLDVQRYFMIESSVSCKVDYPRLGSYSFHFVEYMKHTFEDLVMSLQTIKHFAKLDNRMLHLKIVPIGIGYGIKTCEGISVYKHIFPFYICAIVQACNVVCDATWIHTLEFVDHTAGYLSPFYTNSEFEVVLQSERAVLDFSNAKGIPTLLCPCDAFEIIGSLPNTKSLACSIANQTDLRTVLQTKQPEYMSWPFV